MVSDHGHKCGILKCVPKDLEGFERGILDTANLFGCRKQNDGKAWNANDAGKKEKCNETVDQLEIHLSARTKISNFASRRAQRIPALGCN